MPKKDLPGHMLFTSLAFGVFLPLAFAGYWLVARLGAKWQNLFLLLASFVFYGWWDKRMLLLMASCVIWTYLWGRLLAKCHSRGLLALAIAGPLTVLFVFKYFNFFIPCARLELVVPLGLSFYTFMAIGYLADVYMGKVAAESDLLAFGSFLAFFPQIAAGPIGRAGSLLPQYHSTRKLDFDEASHGLCLIAYGLFKKMAVADLLSLYVDFAFRNAPMYSTATCIIGAVFFAVQIYCDFSGYSDMARGVAKLFGIELMLNFNRPYLAKTFGEFWRRWHISLSTWFRDYVYIPLGGSRCTLPRTICNVWVVFLLSGLWHGAAWTFVAWGALHAVFLTGGILRRKLGLKIPDSRLPVFAGVTFAWILFKASSWEQLAGYLKMLFAFKFRTSMSSLFAGQGPVVVAFEFAACALLALSYLLPPDAKPKSTTGRLAFIGACIAAIVFMGIPGGGEFIYFQF